MINLIKKYLSSFSVTGNEHALAELIKEDIAPYVDSITEDAMGNLIAFKKGEDSSERTMFAAHMDEIGFVVTYIEESGFIRVAQVGGINPIASSYGEVVFENGVKGVIAVDAGTTFADISVKKLFVDIGAKSKKEAEKKVSVGMYLSLTQRMTRLTNNRLAAKAFDDRVACAVLVKAASEAKFFKHDTYYVFTVHEEVGRRGATAAANAILPTYGIACDVTPSFDVPGASGGAVAIGKGAAIKIKDSSAVCSQRIVNELTKLAENAQIKYQYEVLTAGGTDTGSMQVAGPGCFAGCVSIPLRYVHSPIETLDKSDLDACVSLIKEFTEKA